MKRSGLKGPFVGDIINLSIDHISAGGDGIAYYGAYVIFVPYSAPQDELLAKITAIHTDYAKAEIVKLLEAGPGRAEAPCPLYTICGGCNLQHLNYEAQLKAKLNIAKEAFVRSGLSPIPSLKIIPSQAFAYRNRVQFHINNNNQPGFSRAESNSVVSLPNCPILVPTINQWLKDVEEQKYSISKAALLKKRFTVFGSENRIFIEGTDTEAGISLAEKNFRFAPESFFQSNVTMAAQLAGSLSWNLAGETAADLYCGCGLFSAFLQASYKHFYCVERDFSSIKYAQLNVGKGASFFAMSIEDWIKSPQAKMHFDLVLVDPPRSGLSKSVKEWLINTRPDTISYISCDPVTLARDSSYLVAKAYKIELAELYDFYPQTSHIESHVQFSLR